MLDELSNFKAWIFWNATSQWLYLRTDTKVMSFTAGLYDPTVKYYSARSPFDMASVLEWFKLEVVISSEWQKIIIKSGSFHAINLRKSKMNHKRSYNWSCDGIKNQNVEASQENLNLGISQILLSVYWSLVLILEKAPISRLSLCSDTVQSIKTPLSCNQISSSISRECMWFSWDPSTIIALFVVWAVGFSYLKMTLANHSQIAVAHHCREQLVSFLLETILHASSRAEAVWTRCTSLPYLTVSVFFTEVKKCKMLALLFSIFCHIT